MFTPNSVEIINIPQKYPCKQNYARAVLEDQKRQSDVKRAYVTFLGRWSTPGSHFVSLTVENDCLRGGCFQACQNSKQYNKPFCKYPLGVTWMLGRSSSMTSSDLSFFTKVKVSLCDYRLTETQLVHAFYTQLKQDKIVRLLGCLV